MSEPLIPILDWMKRDLLAGNYLLADETFVGVQTREKTDMSPMKKRQSIRLLVSGWLLEREALLHIEGEGAVGINMLPLQGRERAEVDRCKPVPPLFFLQHLLNHESIHVHETDLHQMQ